SAVEKQCLSNAKDVSRTRLAVSRKILLTEALVPHIACVGPVASRCANVKAVAMSCSAGTTRLISPMRSAAAAVRRSPVSKNSQIPPDFVVKSQPTDIVDIVLQLIRRPNGAHRACHSRKSRGELWFVLYLVADSRQIIWRESLRSLCKHSARAPTVLPHNVAWPFLPFLPWCGRHVSAAMICGRKRPLTLNLASMLRKMVLPDNVAL